MYNTTCPHLFLKIFVNFLTSLLLRAQNTMLLSKVRQIFFSNFVAFSENPNFTFYFLFLIDNFFFSESSAWLTFKNAGNRPGKTHFCGRSPYASLYKRVVRWSWSQCCKYFFLSFYILPTLIVHVVHNVTCNPSKWEAEFWRWLEVWRSALLCFIVNRCCY